MNQTFVDKLTYLLDYLENVISSSVCDVIADSEEDPQYSAVTAANLIKCYIDVKLMLGQRTNYSDIEGYLRYNCFTAEDVQVFEQKRLRESAYYIGEQY